jgi:hypothetical protein
MSSSARTISSSFYYRIDNFSQRRLCKTPPEKKTLIITNTSTTHLQRRILKNCFPWINMFSATAIISATKQQHEVWFLSKIWTRQKVHTLVSTARLSPQTSCDFFLIDLFLFFCFSQQDLQQRLRAFPQSVTNET